MLIIRSKNNIKKILGGVKNIGLIPTMGNLHDGHIELIKSAKKKSKLTIVSIFVNPIQFNSKQDLKNYPKTIEKDIKILEKLNVDYLFLPSIEDIYPNKPNLNYQLPKISNELCGKTKKDHFKGVLTVIDIFFNIFKPAYAFFGKKDYQQLYLIKKFIKDKKFPIQIIEIETIRKKNMLALSSRNNLLSNVLEHKAINLYKSLDIISREIKSISMIPSLEMNAIDFLQKKGWQVDYIEIRRQSDLEKPTINDIKLVVLGAATLKNVRLIDNIEFCIDKIN
jgi:pantoate--beta-alanine ligase